MDEGRGGPREECVWCLLLIFVVWPSLFRPGLPGRMHRGLRMWTAGAAVCSGYEVWCFFAGLRHMDIMTGVVGRTVRAIVSRTLICVLASLKTGTNSGDGKTENGQQFGAAAIARVVCLPPLQLQLHDRDFQNFWSRAKPVLYPNGSPSPWAGRLHSSTPRYTPRHHR
jgi:hypothetical protein